MDTQAKLIDTQAIKDVLNFYDLALYFEEKSLKSSYNSVTMCCPFHKDDTPSFAYSIEKKTFYCFGCHIKGDAVNYVQKKLECSFKSACDFMCKFAGLDPKYVSAGEKIALPSYKKELAILKRSKESKLDSFEAINEEQIKGMVMLRGDFFKDRGLTKETLDFFQVGFDIKEKRVIVPIRNEVGTLVGSTGRTIYKPVEIDSKKVFRDELGNTIPKWKHYKLSNIKENFFNINNAIKFSKDRNNSIIICEGPNDVMYLHQCGYKNVVACLSNNIGNIQKGILLKNFISLYLFLDGDLGGETGKSAIYKSLKDYFTIYDVKAVEGKDPDEMTQEEIEEAFKNAKCI